MTDLIEMIHVVSWRGYGDTVACDTRISCAGRCAHRMIAAAADSGSGEAVGALVAAEARNGAFASALDSLERYGYVVRGESLSGPVVGKWVVLDVASVPDIIHQREMLAAQGYEVIEPIDQPAAGSEG